METRQQQNLTTTLEVDPNNVQALFSNFLQSLQDEVKNTKDSNEIILSHSIRIVDSGGQPQFHEIIAIFLAHISGFVSVFKLSEALAEHGEVVLYDNGEPINDPYKSHYSHEQVIRHDLQVIQSEAIRSGLEEMPNLAFVGTFLDEQHKCECETPDQKDQRLHNIITEILPEELQECVITPPGGSLQSATFRINAKIPQKQDFDKVDRLKGALLEKSRVKSKPLPLKWHGYEVALQMLMQELKQPALSRRECEFIGFKLGFDHTSLSAALNYLRQLNIIAYYDELPNVIFGSSQVILDKITELVRYNLELKKGQSVLGGAERKFVEQGIVSLQFLRSPSLAKHYTPELFKPEDLLKVIISQLVVSAVSAKEFIMPCVLEVSTIYPSPPIPKDSVRSSFILAFSKSTPMFGLYCCTISSLMTDSGWKLSTERRKVVPVARNKFTFEIPMGLPGKLTIIDPISSYFEIILELPARVANKYRATLYPKIRDTLFEAIKKAMITLHYSVKVPKVSFLCPEQSSPSARCSKIPHLATVDDNQDYLKCSLEPSSVYFPVDEEHKIWLPDTSGAAVGIVKGDNAGPGISQAKFNLAKKHGIAVIVTCDYKDNCNIDTLETTNTDAVKLTDTFKILNYDIIPLKNEQVTESAVLAIVKQLSEYLKNYDGATDNGKDATEITIAKAIVFAFSGHGIKDNVVLANNGDLIFLRDVVKPLVDRDVIGEHSDEIPKLFFIDACRGNSTFKVPEAKGDSNVNDIQGNFNIEFATINDHRAYTGSWISVLACELKNDDTYQNVLAEAKKKTIERYKLQQAQTQGQLTTGRFKLYYKRYGTS